MKPNCLDNYHLTPDGQLHIFKGRFEANAFATGWATARTNGVKAEDFCTQRAPGRPLTVYDGAADMSERSKALQILSVFLEVIIHVTSAITFKKVPLHKFPNGDQIVFSEKEELAAFQLGRRSYQIAHRDFGISGIGAVDEALTARRGEPDAPAYPLARSQRPRGITPEN